MGKPVHWSNLAESGTEKGLLFLFWLNRILGRRFFDIILYPVMAYYFLSNGLARRSSRQFLQQHAKAYPEFWSKPPGSRDVFANMYAFGQCILDKSLGWNSTVSEEDFDIADRGALEQFMGKTNGQLIIGSHFGNLEYCRGFVQRNKEKVINVLVYDQHSANFVNAMAKLNPLSRVNVFQVSDMSIPLVLQLKAKVEQGEWLFIAGDRVPLSGDVNTVEVEFLGRPTRFPIGPYMLAKVLQCEVQLMFAYRSGKKVFFELVPFAEQVTLPRKESQQALLDYAQKYASELQRQVAKAPYEWFNFYPYWDDAEIGREEASYAK